MDFQPFRSVILPPERGTQIPAEGGNNDANRTETTPVVLIPDRQSTSPTTATYCQNKSSVNSNQPRAPWGVAYDGELVGVLYPSKRITSRTAWKRAASRLSESIEGFDPDRMSLYRLVAVDPPGEPLPVDVERFETI